MRSVLVGGHTVGLLNGSLIVLIAELAATSILFLK